ncbi:hypothetical protein KAJ27_25560 [bacterium]|nr:hypothetical protein [bacterium]
MTEKIIVVLLAVFFLGSFAYTADEGNPVVSFEFLLNRQMNEVKAGVLPEETGAIKDIKDVLKTSDNYLDLEFALDTFRKYQKQKNIKKNLRPLAPVAKVLLEKITFSSVKAKRDLAAEKKEFRKYYTAFSKKPLKKGFMLDGPKSKVWKPIIVSIKDKKSERRVKLLKDITDRHSGRIAASYSYTKGSDKLDTYNYILEGDAKFVERLTGYYDAKRPSKSLSVKLNLQSGGMLSKINSTVNVNAPAELGPVGALNWINNKVIGKDWDYIYESLPKEFDKHKTEKEKDGNVMWRVKNGKIKYTIVYPAEPNIVLQVSEEDSGTKYYETR